MITFDIALISLYSGAVGSAAKIVRGLCKRVAVTKSALVMGCIG